jgi:hypothetical protein
MMRQNEETVHLPHVHADEMLLSQHTTMAMMLISKEDQNIASGSVG